MKKIKVLYICGETRSGSTILSNILGSIDGFFNGGEIIEFWKTGIEWPCSCGKKTSECKIWSPIYQKALSNANIAKCDHMNQFIGDSARSFKSFKSLISSDYYSKIKKKNNQSMRSLQYLYKQIKNSTSCNVIIDASKNPGYAHLLSMIPEIELFLVHIIRDPRATIYSWLIKKPGLWTASYKKIAMRWNIRNAASEMFKRKKNTHYYQVKYENFATYPLRTIKEILAFICEAPEKFPFHSDSTVYIDNIHGLCGNPDRFKQGKIEIHLDQKWKSGLPTKEKIFSTFTNFPFILRYRYPLIGVLSKDRKKAADQVFDKLPLTETHQKNTL